MASPTAGTGYVPQIRPFPDPFTRDRFYARPVTSFLVFRDLPRVTRDQYAAAQHAAADASRRSSASGREVRYQGGFFLPGASRAVCIFDAESAADVAAVNEQAGLPAAEVVEAIDLRTTTQPALARRLDMSRKDGA